jgi:glucokinase
LNWLRILGRVVLFVKVWCKQVYRYLNYLCYLVEVKTVLTIDIGGTNISVGVFHESRLKGKRTRPTNRAAGPEWTLDAMEEMVAELGFGSDFDACGIGFGGPVDFAAQKVITSTHVRGWEGFGLVEEVVSRFRAPAIMDRDSMAGALGEGRYGAGKGFRPLFYITLSTGIGGGLLTDSGLFRGADSYACELGHHTIVPSGPACLCGSFGCLERMCSGLWMERDYGRPAEELFRDADFLARYVGYLAQGLKNCLMFINPARIVIGGGISNAGDRLFLPLREELFRQMPPWSKARADVVSAQLVGESVLWGALALAEEYL